MSDDTFEESERYSEERGIDLAGTDVGELFKWFLASLLYGAWISEPNRLDPAADAWTLRDPLDAPT